MEIALDEIDSRLSRSAIPVEVLEVGTSGIFPLVISDITQGAVVSVTHLDPNRPSVSDLGFRHDTANRAYRCFTANLEMEPLDCPDSSFDVVLLCEVVEHFELDPMAGLAEINRVMRPDSTLVVTTPNINSYRAVYKMLHGYSPYFFMKYTTKYGRHNYEYSVPDLSNLLMSAGFIEDRMWTEDTFEDPLPEDIERTLADAIALAGGQPTNRGDNIFAVYRKAGPVIDRYPASSYAYVN